MKIIFIVLALGFAAFLAMLPKIEEKLDLPILSDRAGSHGEAQVSKIISDHLSEDDFLFSNVPIEFNGKRSKLDRVVVNSRGIFVFAVGNYKGELTGEADDEKWSAKRVSDSGKTHEKSVDNPLKKVRGDVSLLSKYLEHYGISMWISGYAFLLNGNSPVESVQVIASPDELDRAIHRSQNQKLEPKTVEYICKLLHR